MGQRLRYFKLESVVVQGNHFLIQGTLRKAPNTVCMVFNFENSRNDNSFNKWLITKQ